MARADAEKNKIKIAKEILANPLQTEKELVKKTGLGKGTVHRQKKELEKNKFFQDILNKSIDSRYLISDSFKELVSDDLINQFIEYCGNIYTAKDVLEKLILLHLGKTRIRKNISTNTRYSLLEKAGFKCQCCGEKPLYNNDITLQIDHITPVNLGGICAEKNYQVLCNLCNSSKGDSFNYNHNYEQR